MSDRDELAEAIRNGVDAGYGALPAEHFYPEADAILASDWLARVKAEAWDQGFSAGVPMPTGSTNPYRIRSEAGIGGGDDRG